MAYKMFSSAQMAPGKDGSPEKPKEAPPAGKPTTQPDDRKPAEVSPAPKS